MIVVLGEERPWGKYEIIDEGEEFKVKKITVNPNRRLSLQKHSKRDEFWTIVKGIGKIEIGYETSSILDYIAKPGLSYNIPCGAIHRITSDKEELIFIEVQTGSYLEEDDIIRFEDDYNREVVKKKLSFLKDRKGTNTNYCGINFSDHI